MLIKMSSSILSRLLANASAAESRLLELRKELEYVRKIKISEKIEQLSSENEALKVKVENAKNNLIKLEIQNGKKQYPIPARNSATVNSTTAQNGYDKEPSKVAATEIPAKNEPNVDVSKEKKPKEAKKGKEKPASAPVASEVIDVRKLDFRIGKIIEINKHPDADSLYVEKIDCGEENPRTVVSGLVNHVPIDEMRERIVMVLCNLKPVKMRGVTSEAMVMCASSPEKVEVLIPPPGAVPGDLVHCEGFPREPEPILNPKKKIFETCAPDLQTNDSSVACFKGSPLEVPGKGPVKAPSLKNVSVK